MSDSASRGFSTSRAILYADDNLGDLLLQQAMDWPEEWQEHGRHPEDYKIVPEPIKPYFVVHDRAHHYRIWYRVSFKVPGGFLPASFLVDTGAPAWLYLSGECVLACRVGTSHGTDEHAQPEQSPDCLKETRQVHLRLRSRPTAL
jgi:hypothetical protein